MFIFIQRDFEPLYTKWITDNNLTEDFDYEFFTYDSTRREELVTKVNNLFFVFCFFSNER